MAKKETKRTRATNVSKRQEAFAKLVDSEKTYSLSEAIKVLKSVPAPKFDETLDIAINLGIDARNSDQNVRGAISLPNGLGKDVRVAVFAQDANAEAAKKAGADIVGTDDLVEQIQKGELNFDRCIATPDLMALVGKVAKTLGPKGLMPNPKLGTVTNDVADAVKNAKSGQVEFRNEKGGVVHAGVGKVSFEDKKLEENIRTLMGALNQAKPSDLKKAFIKSASLSTSMGPGVKLDIATL